MCEPTRIRGLVLKSYEICQTEQSDCVRNKNAEKEQQTANQQNEIHCVCYFWSANEAEY